MEHTEARELLEIAAVEPGGFERLTAGDTPEAAAARQPYRRLPRLRRGDGPPASRRGRHPRGAFVPRRRRTCGIGRSRSSPRSGGPVGLAARRARPSPGLRRGCEPRAAEPVRLVARARPAAPARAPVYGRPRSRGGRPDRGRRDVRVRRAIERNGRGGTGDPDRGARPRSRPGASAIDGQPDAAVRRARSTTDGSGLSGTLAFSPDRRGSSSCSPRVSSSRRPACSTAAGSRSTASRRRIGQMFFAGDVAFWVGPVDEVADAVPRDARFGVSLGRRCGRLALGRSGPRGQAVVAIGGRPTRSEGGRGRDRPGRRTTPWPLPSDAGPTSPRVTGLATSAPRPTSPRCSTRSRPSTTGSATILSLGLGQAAGGRAVVQSAPGSAGRCGDRRRGRHGQARRGPRGSGWAVRTRFVAVDLSPGMVERGSAQTRDLVQLEFLLADALALPFDDGRLRRRDDRLRPRQRCPISTAGSGSSAASCGRAAASSASSRRCRDRAGGGGSIIGPPAASPRSRVRRGPRARPTAGWRPSSAMSRTPRRSPT